MKATTSSAESPSKPARDEARRYGGHKEAISSKYAAIREQQTRQSSSNPNPPDNIPSTKVSLLNPRNSQPTNTTSTDPSPPKLASTWASMKSGFQSLKANIAAKKYIPLRQQTPVPNDLPRLSSSDSLDEIFQRLKRPSLDRSNGNGDEDEMDIWVLGLSMMDPNWQDIQFDV